jgi:xylulokinase
MSDRDVVLAIDMGTSGPKVALVDGTGKVLGYEFEATELLLSPGGGAEQRPDDWWTAIDTAARRLMARGLVEATRIVAVCATSQWSGTVALDAEGRHLRNAISWMDSRGAKAVERLSGGFPSVEGYAAAKLMRWLRLTGGAPARSGKDPVGHIAWLREAEPEIYARTHKFLEPKDWINLRLTGKFAASYDSIALHWVTDNRDPSSIDYHPALLGLTGLDRDKLPELHASTDVLAPLRGEISRAWGLPDDVPVVMGTPDVHSAAIGSGGVNDYEPHAYIGTSSWLCCHVPFKKTDVFHSIASLPAGIPGRYLAMDEQETAGACLNHLRDNLFFRDDGLGTGVAPKDVYRRFDDLADAAAPGSGRLIFTPWLYGERTPIEDHSVRGGFFNLSLSTTRAEIIRSVFEGVAYNSRWLLGYVEKFCGRKFDAIRMIGGGARSPVWCQIFADVLDRPIKQMADPIEAGARGVAALALVGLGKLDFETFGASVAVEREYEPRSEHRAVYDALFEEFVDIYRRNRRAYRRLNTP